MNITSLSERAMLASLNIRRWQAALTDKKVSAEVATNHAVNPTRAGKYRKNAIDTKAPSFEAVVEHGIGAAEQTLLLYAPLESGRCAHPPGIDL